MMKLKAFSSISSVMLGLSLLLSTAGGTATALEPQPAFQRAWSRTDGVVAAGLAARPWIWGPGPFFTTTEPFGTGTRQVQYYDKGRMEITYPDVPVTSPAAVTNGRLVTELIAGMVEVGPNIVEYGTPAQVPVAGESAANPNAPTYASFRFVASLNNDRQVPPRLGQPVIETIARDGFLGQNPHLSGQVTITAYSYETGHNIPDVFVNYLESRGPVSDGYKTSEATVIDAPLTVGFPLTEAYWTQVHAEGRLQDVLVQLFERRTLLYWPGRPAGYQVEFGNVGQHYYLWRYYLGATPGQSVTYNNALHLVVTSVTRQTTEPGPAPKPGQQAVAPLSTTGAFVVVQLNATNAGATTSQLNLENFILVDSQGRQYEISKEALALAAARMQLAAGNVSVRPGFSVPVVGVWEVPADAHGLIMVPGFGQKPALAVE